MLGTFHSPLCNDGDTSFFRQWFSQTEFGTYWSLLSTSMNVACSAGPIVATFIISALGWRYLFNLFGEFLSSISLVSFSLTSSVSRDSPFQATRLKVEPL